MSLSLKTRAERFVATLRHCQVLGLSVVSAEGNTLIMKLPYQQQAVGNPATGVFHGGSLTTLMDTACGTGCGFPSCRGLNLCARHWICAMDYMKAAEPGEDLLAEATVVRIASSVVFTECLVYQQSDRDLVAKCSATFMRIGENMTPPEFRARIEQDDAEGGEA